MKLIATLLTFIFIATASVQAGSMKEIYTSVNEEIEFYYHAAGDWAVVKVSEMRFIPSDNPDYVIISAKATVRNMLSGRGVTETCLLTYKAQDLEFQTINCF